MTYDGEIPVPATSTMVPIDTRASAHTTDPAGPVQVSIDDNRGTVSFGGSPSLPAFIYRRIPWPDVGFTLLAGLAVDEGAGVWLPFWLYCTSDGVLGQFYAERTDRPDTVNEIVSGSCNIQLTSWNMPVNVPAHHLRGVAMTCGFDVMAPPSEPPLSLHSSELGTATIDGAPANAVVFSTTDCRTGCGSASWFELHSVVWQPASNQAAFAIWYLEGQGGPGVSGENGLLLPAVGWTDILHPRATWSLDR